MNTILLFPGQGAQVVGMGKAWYDASSTVREYFDLADKMLPFRLSELCFNGPTEALQETRVCQPALFVVGYAIFAHMKKLGIFDENPIGKWMDSYIIAPIKNAFGQIGAWFSYIGNAFEKDGKFGPACRKVASKIQL